MDAAKTISLATNILSTLNASGVQEEHARVVLNTALALLPVSGIQEERAREWAETILSRAPLPTPEESA